MALQRLAVTGMAAALLAVVAMPAAAQPPPEQRGYVLGFGGATFTEVNSGLFGAAVGVNLGRNVQVFGEIARMQDIQADFSRADLTALEDATGGALAVSARVPAFYGVGGVRVLMPATRNLRPYVLGSAGVAHVMPEPSFVVQGVDVTSTVMQEQVFQTSFKTANRPIASAGAGVSVEVVRHVVLDVGYKYSRIFIQQDYLQDPASPTKHNGVNVHRVYVGAGYSF
ncbi:MAG: outer membrane beta-barrel protein [Betaproteobacteria bacterium]